ncbi:MAG: hypothetical protein EBR81_04910 [Proteobacteria bacterium]|nr:hypothetical protein [Pseudomonadota bacterium]
MDYTEALAAAGKSKGLVVVLTAWSAPTKPKVFEDRERDAASRYAKHRALGRVKTTGESFTDEQGRITFQFKVAGQVNRDVHPLGAYLNAKGEPAVDLVISAPTEYGFTTACKYAGVEGSACVKRAAFHGHRTINLTRLVSWMIAGEEQVKPQQGC